MSVSKKNTGRFLNKNSKMINQIRTIDNNHFNHFEKLQKIKKNLDNTNFNNTCMIELKNMKDVLLKSKYFNEYQYSNISILMNSLEFIFKNMKYTFLLTKFHKMFQKVDLHKDKVSYIFMNTKNEIEDMISYIYKNYYNSLPLNILNEIVSLKEKVKKYNKSKEYEKTYKTSYVEYYEDDNLYESDIDMIERTFKHIDSSNNTNSSDTDSDYELNTFDNIDCDIKNNITNDLSLYENNDSEIDDYIEENDNNSINEDDFIEN